MSSRWSGSHPGEKGEPARARARTTRGRAFPKLSEAGDRWACAAVRPAVWRTGEAGQGHGEDDLGIEGLEGAGVPVGDVEGVFEVAEEGLDGVFAPKAGRDGRP